jgi:hypothetical protein
MVIHLLFYKFFYIKLLEYNKKNHEKHIDDNNVNNIENNNIKQSHNKNLSLYNNLDKISKIKSYIFNIINIADIITTIILFIYLP